MSGEFIDKLTKCLLDKGIVDRDTLVKALRIREKEDQISRRSVAQVLVEDLNVDHDKVFSEVKNLYGFREITLNGEPLKPNRVQFIKKMFEVLPDPLQQEIKKALILPFRYDEARPEKILILTIDPTHRLIPHLLRALGIRRYEICYMRKRSLESLFLQIFPAENEFLKNVDLASNAGQSD